MYFTQKETKLNSKEVNQNHRIMEHPKLEGMHKGSPSSTLSTTQEHPNPMTESCVAALPVWGCAIPLPSGAQPSPNPPDPPLMQQ